jgi:hypothetical protein
MRTCSFFLRSVGAIVGRGGLSAGTALLAACALAAPASASTRSGPPVYTLKISEGETTIPENSIESTSGSVEPSSSVALSIVRGGTVIARSHPGNGGTWMSQVPEVGDIVNLEAPLGTVVGSVEYDGRPSMDPTVCAGSTNFSGENSPGETVKGKADSLALEIEEYGSSVKESSFQRAQVTILSGTTFGGSFLAPLELGQTVTAIEALETPLAGGAVFDYVSENTRPVGACPVVVVPPPPPPPPALQGSLLKLGLLTLLTLLKSGLRDLVTINQPGTVTQDLYLENGTLPAFAATSKSKHHNKPPPALLVARGATVASSAGTVTMSLKLTVKGRRKLKSAKHARLVLVTTLRTSSGAELNLARRTVLLHR